MNKRTTEILSLLDQSGQLKLQNSYVATIESVKTTNDRCFGVGWKDVVTRLASHVEVGNYTISPFSPKQWYHKVYSFCCVHIQLKIGTNYAP